MYLKHKIVLLCLVLIVVETSQAFSKATLEENEEVVTSEPQDFPLDFGHVFNDARNVFGNVVKKIFSKKRLLGLDSNWKL